MRDLVHPGGALVAVGVARARYPADIPRDVAASLGTRAHQLANWRRGRRLWGTPAPKVWPPDDDFRETRAAVERARGWSHGRAEPDEADSAGDPGAR